MTKTTTTTVKGPRRADQDARNYSDRTEVDLGDGRGLGVVLGSADGTAILQYNGSEIVEVPEAEVQAALARSGGGGGGGVGTKYVKRTITKPKTQRMVKVRDAYTERSETRAAPGIRVDVGDTQRVYASSALPKGSAQLAAWRGQKQEIAARHQQKQQVA